MGMNDQRAALADLVKLMDKKQIAALNLMFQHTSPITLVGGLETLVALLRNHYVATNVDVELYFQDFTKLILKLQRIDPATLDKLVVEKHAQDFKTIAPAFKLSTHEDF
jgi:hypothetical protein